MMTMTMILTKTSELTIVRRDPESRLRTSRLPEGPSKASSFAGGEDDNNLGRTFTGEGIGSKCGENMIRLYIMSLTHSLKVLNCIGD